MWLTLSSIVLASSLGFNVVALWLTGSFERKRTQTYPRIGHQGNGCQRSAEMSAKGSAVGRWLVSMLNPRRADASSPNIVLISLCAAQGEAYGWCHGKSYSVFYSFRLLFELLR